MEKWIATDADSIPLKGAIGLHPFSQLPYTFDGPFIYPESLSREPGVFAVFSAEDTVMVCEVGEGENVQAMALESRNSRHWEQEYRSLFYIATYTASRQGRKVIEKQLKMLGRKLRLRADSV